MLRGQGGNDLLGGGRGRDRLRGGPGRDRLLGGRAATVSSADRAATASDAKAPDAYADEHERPVTKPSVSGGRLRLQSRSREKPSSPIFASRSASVMPHCHTRVTSRCGSPLNRVPLVEAVEQLRVGRPRRYGVEVARTAEMDQADRRFVAFPLRVGDDEARGHRCVQLEHLVPVWVDLRWSTSNKNTASTCPISLTVAGSENQPSGTRVPGCSAASSITFSR